MAKKEGKKVENKVDGPREGDRVLTPPLKRQALREK
jgi:hypothetical protein